eukprot:GHVN01082343.1.p1 GENE.GHVN01082343.1~~GHVN01082343.1.p1  ORF type:complete len:637 (-),score=119.80 GHVN01082343.1:2081-3991(-)
MPDQAEQTSAEMSQNDALHEYRLAAAAKFKKEHERKQKEVEQASPPVEKQNNIVERPTEFKPQTTSITAPIPLFATPRVAKPSRSVPLAGTAQKAEHYVARAPVITPLISVSDEVHAKEKLLQAQRKSEAEAERFRLEAQAREVEARRRKKEQGYLKRKKEQEAYAVEIQRKEREEQSRADEEIARRLQAEFNTHEPTIEDDERLAYEFADGTPRHAQRGDSEKMDEEGIRPPDETYAERLYGDPDVDVAKALAASLWTYCSSSQDDDSPDAQLAKELQMSILSEESLYSNVVYTSTSSSLPSSSSSSSPLPPTIAPSSAAPPQQKRCPVISTDAHQWQKKGTTVAIPVPLPGTILTKPAQPRVSHNVLKPFLRTTPPTASTALPHGGVAVVPSRTPTKQTWNIPTSSSMSCKTTANSSGCKTHLFGCPTDQVETIIPTAEFGKPEVRSTSSHSPAAHGSVQSKSFASLVPAVSLSPPQNPSSPSNFVSPPRRQPHTTSSELSQSPPPYSAQYYLPAAHVLRQSTPSTSPGIISHHVSGQPNHSNSVATHSGVQHAPPRRPRALEQPSSTQGHSQIVQQSTVSYNQPQQARNGPVYHPANIPSNSHPTVSRHTQPTPSSQQSLYHSVSQPPAKYSQ